MRDNVQQSVYNLLESGRFLTPLMYFPYKCPFEAEIDFTKVSDMMLRDRSNEPNTNCLPYKLYWMLEKD